ncbi:MULTISPECIES: PP2C family protein-serine/threonine phosphatase [Streptomycetaceae]|uniref:Magnesium or manganese-dependent protein phosphatase n=1 Tax=Streptantibioticus cattleyicolor (strain ATCC 35852 / DSM 46488 / JCM 4925 / NBRC 14057 / NRRL 8057) TaxID=1003195 RepID=F8K3R5_STREN|nr:PP2C family protein-serine/threonine phosphatase [Streptantibioticus cattleyicolor]AEW97603.1 magnesium or manganese-dependent protein phosphatase [Streptantibioticus cattleyicolor NRRL 8057 = DSM 46488]MYS62033.1 SpoIIE family protein phosphatase [Streptomyces sp. SID5468]CCB77926.1 Magnesium or manganese-dependent protein phosphatase [Streptantibioticus cattleyicolor NRRL 8057 = DSM 46488]
MNRFEAAERALRTAAPHELLDAVRAVLVERYGAKEVELFMADYGLAVLQPVSELPHTLDPVSVHNSPAGRAFGSQEPYCEDLRTGARLHLPVSVRGDRLGVLSVTLPDRDAARDCASELAQIADVLGHEVVVAERDTDLYLQARRKGRLTLAAEMQWQLLPGRSCSRPEYDLGAQLEPAYAIFGDNFDWSATADRLMLYVTNGMGEGIEASLLTNLAINALRNARRAGISIADQAALADQAVYAHYQGRCYLSVLMFDFDLATGRASVVDAGSPQLLRMRDGVVERITFDAQLPLGMFEETDYVAQDFQAEPGDRLVFVSDGVHAVASPKGEAYGEAALARAIQSTRLLPAAEVPRAILRELTGHRGEALPADDALIVCLDWRGRPLGH